MPFANKDELEKQLPVLKKKFLYAEDFAKAKFTDIFPQEELDKATVFTANYFSNAILINRGNLNFEVTAMPWQAQLSSFRDAVVVDANRTAFRISCSWVTIMTITFRWEGMMQIMPRCC